MKIIRYYRVSTAQQGRSGLGLEAQEAAVDNFCSSRECRTLGTYTEIESGKKNNRPKLMEAIHHAKMTNSTLIVAKFDRLTRDVEFMASLMKSKVKFQAADMPDANNFTIHIMVAVAEQERLMISARTKAALAAAKARGVVLGNPHGAQALQRSGKGNTAAIETIKDNANTFAKDMADIIMDIQGSGLTTLRAIAQELNDREYMTPRGSTWQANSVRQLLNRINERTS